MVKRVDGTAASSSHVTAPRSTIAVQCAVDVRGQRVTVVDDTVTVAGDGVVVPVTDDAGNPVLVPLGARCWGTEAETFGARTVTIDHNSYDTGVTVVADTDAVQPLLITVTNTFETAQLVISKQAVNGPDPIATFTFDVSCTIARADGTASPCHCSPGPRR